MKKRYILSLFLLALAGFSARAQTETIASKPKKLQQLYVSLGTGPAATTSQTAKIAGGTYLFNITAAFGPASVFRLHVQRSDFTNYRATSPGIFSYLSANNYYNNFSPDNRNTSINFSYGKRKKLNKLIQVQTLAGVGLNMIDTYDYQAIEANLSEGEVFRCGTPYSKTYFKPGLLLQAEAQFLPSKFAGLTAGAYANLTPKLPSAGINLSLNLGMLK